MAAVHSLVS